MSPIRLPIFHVLYTNAPGEDWLVGGFRGLQVGFGGTPEDRKPIDEWLRGLEPAEGSRQGWATNSFKVSGVRCAALAVVNPSFSMDESGRGGGRLTHALIVTLEEGKPIGHFSRALYAIAFNFLEQSRSFSQSLRAYLEGCRLNDYVEIDEIRPDDLDRLFDLIPIVQALIDACKEGASEVVLSGITDEEALPEKILAASAMLPPTLRLALHWRVGLQPGGEGFVVRPGRASGPPSPARFGVGQAYAEDLWRRLQGGEADELATIINGSWEIKDWRLPASATASAPPLQEFHALQTLPKSEPETEENVRNKRERASAGAKGKNTSVPPQTSASTPAPRQTSSSAADYDQERQSLYDELESYINQRLRNFGVPPPPPARPRAELFGEDAQPGETENLGTSKGSWTEKLLYWRPEIYFLFALLLFLVAIYRKPQSTPPVAQEPEIQSQSIPAGAQEKPAGGSTRDRDSEEATANTDPIARWKSFVKGQPLVAAEWYQAVASHEGLEPEQVSSRQAGRYAEWAKNLKDGKIPADAEITSSAIGLFEYVHALWVKEQRLGDSAKDDRVDLIPGEVAPHLLELVGSQELADLDGGKEPLAAKDLDALVTDSRVQATVVLRWIDEHPKLERVR